MPTNAGGSRSFRRVCETPIDDPPALVHREWCDAYPWLVQGTTRRGEATVPYDLGLFSDASAAVDVTTRWHALATATAMPRVVLAHQVHGAVVRVAVSGPPGIHVSEECDGHATASPDVLLAVTAADCVPVWLVDAGRRAVAVLHAGWRGVAAGVLEAGVAVMRERLASESDSLRVHLGPSICGACYEVGPEVFEALELPPPEAPSALDLRAVLGGRAEAMGVPLEQVTVSEHCTRCGDGLLFSHRSGDRERQVAYVGVRP